MSDFLHSVLNLGQISYTASGDTEPAYFIRPNKLLAAVLLGLAQVVAIKYLWVLL